MYRSMDYATERTSLPNLFSSQWFGQKNLRTSNVKNITKHNSILIFLLCITKQGCMFLGQGHYGRLFCNTDRTLTRMTLNMDLLYTTSIWDSIYDIQYYMEHTNTNTCMTIPLICFGLVWIQSICSYYTTRTPTTNVAVPGRNPRRQGAWAPDGTFYQPPPLPQPTYIQAERQLCRAMARLYLTHIYCNNWFVCTFAAP